MAHDVAKEHIYVEDENGVKRLAVAKGHPIPEGVEVPKSKQESSKEDPHEKARRESHDKALRSQSARTKSEDADQPKRGKGK